MIGRCESFFTTGIALRSRVLRVEVSKVRMPRSQRMTFGLPPASTYSAASSHSWIDVDMPRLSSTGLPDLADPLEQREVLHVAGADLQDVGVLGHQLDLVRLHDLGHDRQAGALARRPQQGEAVLLEPLEGVGRGARLEGAAAEHVRAGGLDALRHRGELGLRLDGARSGHHHDLGAAHRDPVDLELGVVGVRLAARELEGLEDAHHVLHRVERLEREQLLLGPIVPHDPDDGAHLSTGEVALSPELRPRRDVLDVGLARSRLSTMIICVFLLLAALPAGSRFACGLPFTSSGSWLRGPRHGPPHSPRLRTTVPNSGLPPGHGPRTPRPRTPVRAANKNAAGWLPAACRFLATGWFVARRLLAISSWEQAANGREGLESRPPGSVAAGRRSHRGHRLDSDCTGNGLLQSGASSRACSPCQVLRWRAARAALRPWNQATMRWFSPLR